MSHSLIAYVVKLSDIHGQNDLCKHVLPVTNDFGLTLEEGLLQGKEYVKVITDYFGGFGEQMAQIKKDGVVFKEYDTDYAIDEALKEFGVIANPEMDEFDTLKLGHYRSIYDLYEKIYGEKMYKDDFNEDNEINEFNEADEIDPDYEEYETERKFTVEEFKNYILSQDSMGDILYFLSEENIIKANQPKEE